MTDLGQLLTKKIKITSRTQDLNLMVSVLNVLCTLAYLQGVAQRHIDTYIHIKSVK